MAKAKQQTGKGTSKTKELEMKVNKVMQDVEDLVSKAKNKYHEMDPNTKKKIAVGIAGLGALLAGAALIKKKKK